MINTNDINLIRVEDIHTSNKFDIFSYIIMAEYKLYKYHIENGISELEYGTSDINISSFISGISDYYIKHDTKSIIATVNDHPVGFIAYNKIIDGELYIVSIYVDSVFRKSGVATSLIKEVMKSEWDYCKVLIANFNTESKNLFTKLGFELLYESDIHGMSEYHLISK